MHRGLTSEPDTSCRALAESCILRLSRRRLPVLGRCVLTLMSAALLLAVAQGRADELPPGIDPSAAVTLVPTRAGESPADARPVLRVSEESRRGVTLEFDLPALRQTRVEIAGGSYDLLAIENGGFEGAEGAPMVPTFTRLICIPDRSGVRVEVTGVEKTELAGYRLPPMQPGEPGPLVLDADAYLASGYPAAEAVSLGEPVIWRDLRVVPVKFRPVRYDPAGGKLEVAGAIRVRVAFDGEDPRNVKSGRAAITDASFDQLYRNLVVNYGGARDDQPVSLGSYVLICPNDAAVLALLDRLVDWRRQKGFDVYVATTAETGSTTGAIQTWLRNAYLTWPNPPAYVALVGDADGSSSIRIPCFNYNGGDTDFPYVQLDGGDIIPDAHIGRISVRDTGQLETYIEKIVSYESTPYMSDTAWYRRGCVVGDPTYSGYTCVEIGQWLDLRMRANGYTEVDAIYEGPFVSQMAAALTRGDTAFMYRGYVGMSNFDAGDARAVNNGRKMHFSTQITCGTNSFSESETVCEAWIRSGTAAAPRGGVGAVGASTMSTHTRFNNCVTYGIWGGIFNEALYTFGAALTRGKWELYLNYNEGDSYNVGNFSHWDNLIGDPAGEIWTGIPQAISVTHASSLALGANALAVAVTKAGLPLAGAAVCAYKEGEAQVLDFTGTDGTVALPLDALTAGSLTLTVTRHNCQPYQAEIPVAQQARFVGYNAHTLDDDASGSSAGNGDGLANPGELVELPVQARNFGTQAVTGVSALLSSTDPYVTISDGAETFPNLPAGGTGWSTEDFDVEIVGGAPNGHHILCSLDFSSGANTWQSVLEIPVVAAAFTYDAMTLYNFGAVIDPGESGELSVRIRNYGAAAADGVTGVLVSHSNWVNITDSTGTFGTIAIDGTGENSGDRFGLIASAGCYQGHLAALSLRLEFSSGASATVPFTLTVGQGSTDDPTGPDAHGYYAFDNTDTNYPEAPSYAWVEIDPRYGGQGVSAGLTDDSPEGGDSQSFSLPFVFPYYGKNFSSVTICSNGWLAMGGTSLTNYNNWMIPCPGAPANLIAPKWDGLYQSGNDRVYYWADTANHRYIVQWSRVRNDATGATENFEAILYDPDHYPTSTGDGMIVFQYQAFDIGDEIHNYWTTGIQNAECNDGVLYAYFNQYNAGAAPIASGRAIKFVPVRVTPSGVLRGYVRNASDGGRGIPGAEVTIPDRGVFTSLEDGAYYATLPVGVYTVHVAHASFTPDTAYDVVILEDQTTVLDFSLEDVQSPIFDGEPHANTGDPTGPYEILTTVVEYSTFEELALIYNAGGAGWVTVPLVNQGGQLYRGEIPGQPYNSMIRYYLHARDAAGNASADPPGAPAETHLFWVLPPLFVDGIEEGEGTWTHYGVLSGFADPWHRSDARNHTAGGTWSWKCGDTGSGTYPSLADGALQSEAFALDGAAAVLRFWHWMDAETSAAYPGMAYDGGLVEISVNGGAWTQVTPAGGYTHTVRTGGTPGPFPAGTAIFSGTFDWGEEEIDLTGVSGSVRVRFRFGTDGAVEREGWYVDDVEVMAMNPGPAGERETAALPTKLALHPSRPNPFGAGASAARIDFDLPASARVRLAVLDVNGRLIDTLADGPFSAGRHQVSWDGLDARGRRVECGVYFYVLHAGGRELTRRVLLLD